MILYIKRCAQEHYSVEALKRSLASDDFHHQGELPNNFLKTIPAAEQAFRAVNTFKDEYLLDYINVEELNCLVAVELKKGKFKTSYLGQLSGYLSVLDEFERKPHENPSIGIILCKDMNKAFVDFVICDYDKPMGVAT